MKKEPKLTNRYVFRIDRITVRPAEWEDNHGMAYMMRGNKEVKEVEENIFRGEYEIKDEKVIEILRALLK